MSFRVRFSLYCGDMKGKERRRAQKSSTAGKICLVLYSCDPAQPKMQWKQASLYTTKRVEHSWDVRETVQGKYMRIMQNY